MRLQGSKDASLETLHDAIEECFDPIQGTTGDFAIASTDIWLYVEPLV